MEQNTIQKNLLNILPHQEKEMLDFKEAKNLLGISSSSLYKMTSSRTISYMKPNGGKIYFRKSDLVDWMNHNELKSTRVLQKELNNHLKIK